MAWVQIQRLQKESRGKISLLSISQYAFLLHLIAADDNLYHRVTLMRLGFSTLAYLVTIPSPLSPAIVPYLVTIPFPPSPATVLYLVTIPSPPSLATVPYLVTIPFPPSSATVPYLVTIPLPPSPATVPHLVTIPPPPSPATAACLYPSQVVNFSSAGKILEFRLDLILLQQTRPLALDESVK